MRVAQMRPILSQARKALAYVSLCVYLGLD